MNRPTWQGNHLAMTCRVRFGCCRASISRWRIWHCGTRNGDRFAPLLIWCVHRVTGLSSHDGLMKPQ